MPNSPQLRSLNIININNYVAGAFEPRELALQIVDIITLRPEIQLCYVGIAAKCFEILEIRSPEAGSSRTESAFTASSVPLASSLAQGAAAAAAAGAVIIDDEDEDDADGNDDEDSDDDTASLLSSPPDSELATEDDDALVGAAGEQNPLSNGLGHGEDSEDDDGDSLSDGEIRRPRLRLREILFYDDKVAIFKARHGKL